MRSIHRISQWQTEGNSMQCRVTISTPAGVRTIDGIWPSTFEAAIAAVEWLAGGVGKVSVRAVTGGAGVAS